MAKEKFFVLDVEGGSTCRPYNVGFIVADRYGKIYKKYSYAIPEAIWENMANVLKTGIALEMTKSNIQEILMDFQNKRVKRKYKYISINEFYKLLEKLIKRYKIKRLFGDERFNKLNLEYCDIISGILTTKLLTKKYCHFCIENGFLSPKNNILTKAEVVYKYLTNCLDFVEEHTGLSDVLIEYEILLTVFRSHKAVDFKPTVAWIKLKKFCEENGIIY